MKKRITEEIQQHLTHNRKLYIIFVILMFAGIVIGSLCGASACSNSSDEGFFTNFISSFKLHGISSHDLFTRSLFSNIRFFLIIFISGIRFFLFPLSLISCTVKGFGIGYTISYLVCESGFKGFVFSLVSMLSQNLLIIPAIIIYSVSRLSCSIKKRKMSVSDYKNKQKIYRQSIGGFILMLLFCLFCSFTETTIVPFLMKILYASEI